MSVEDTSAPVAPEVPATEAAPTDAAASLLAEGESCVCACVCVCVCVCVCLCVCVCT